MSSDSHSLRETKQGLARFGHASLAWPASYAVAGVLVLLLDLLTGPFLMFPILFVLPVSLATWYCSCRWGMLLAAALPVGRACIAGFYEFPQPLPFVLINAVIRIAVLVFISYLVSRIAQQKKLLENRVKALEGLLPICMFCNRIRDERQNWLQIESYISQHSEARFSHTFCPECGRKHYPELLGDKRDG
jgi:hypothetical protein